jgi:hypothetical protein
MTKDRSVTRENINAEKVILAALKDYRDKMLRLKMLREADEADAVVKKLEDPHTYILIKKQGELNLK